MHLVLELGQPAFNKVGQGKLGCCPVLNKQLNKCLFSTELVEVEWMKILPFACHVVGCGCGRLGWAGHWLGWAVVGWIGQWLGWSGLWLGWSKVGLVCGGGGLW